MFSIESRSRRSIRSGRCRMCSRRRISDTSETISTGYSTRTPFRTSFRGWRSATESIRRRVNLSLSRKQPSQKNWNREMIQVVVEIVAKAGQRHAVLKAFKANVPAVHAEQGCIEYSAFVDPAGFGALAPYGDATIVLVEQW